MPYEHPQGRRVKTLAARVKAGAAPARDWLAKPGSLRAAHLVRFLTALPPSPVPTVVRDNGSIQRRHDVRGRPSRPLDTRYLSVLPPAR